MSLDHDGLDRASFELQRHFGREGSIYGIKACEEVARIAVVAYARAEAAASGWEKANHREESLTRAIHSTPGNEWTFWFSVNGVMYAHRHTLPAFVPPDMNKG